MRKVAIRDDIERFGIQRAITAAILRRLERHLGLHVWAINLRPLRASNDIPAEQSDRFEFRRVTAEEARKATEKPQLGLTPEFVRGALARGDVCEGVFERGRLVAYTWRTTTFAPVDRDLWIRIHDASHRYGYKTLVLPDYRGFGLGPAVQRFNDAWFLDRGLSHVISYIALSNLTARKANERAGDPDRKRIGYAGYLKFRNRYWTFRTPNVRPYLAFEVR